MFDIKDIRRGSPCFISKEEGESKVNTTYADDDARAANDLAGLALTVDLAETNHFAELLGIRNLDEVDVVLLAKSFNELDVAGLIAAFSKNAELSLTPAEVKGKESKTS